MAGNGAGIIAQIIARLVRRNSRGTATHQIHVRLQGGAGAEMQQVMGGIAAMLPARLVQRNSRGTAIVKILVQLLELNGAEAVLQAQLQLAGVQAAARHAALHSPGTALIRMRV